MRDSRLCPNCHRLIRWCVCDWRAMARDGIQAMLDDLDEQRQEWCRLYLWWTSYRLDFTSAEVWFTYQANGYDSAATRAELDAEIAEAEAYRLDLEQTIRATYWM